MDRPKRPPPVPKFEDRTNKTELEAKLNSFMSSINQTQNESSAQSAKTEPVQPPKAENKAEPAVKVEQTKKKATLASINSKLNSMLSAKKININAIAVETEKERQEKQEKNKKVQIQYDPQCPNNYQLTKQQYAKLFASHIEEQQDSEPETQLRAEQTIVEEEDQVQEQVYVAEEKQQVALRMMQKFGYKVGEGLGKQGQGIKTPLIVKKVNDSSGIIEQSNISLSYLIPPQVTAKNALAAHNVDVETVFVLVGLLSMEDLEEGVEQEIKQQCSVFGILKEWIIYLWGEQLRIFVQYSTKEEAFNAFYKMNGKYFGEKLVSVRFYSPQEFHRRNLNCSLHGHIPT